MIDCLPNADATACTRCGWVKPAKIKGWPRRNCPQAIDAAEVARREVICRLCEDWDATGTQGCQLIPAHERTRLTAYKQAHGHCARGCGGGKRKW